MRQIGTMPKGIDPNVFADYLLTLGIKARVDERPDGSHLWVYHEDHVARASDELQSYLATPDEPRFRAAAATAETIRRQERERDKEFRTNSRDVADLWARPGLRRRPLTTLLVTICVTVFLMQEMPDRFPDVESKLSFSTGYIDQDGEERGSGMNEIAHGELWRLVTPVFMHITVLHIFFNMWWIVDLGTAIEVRRGTLRLAILVLVSAVISNLGQYVWMERGDPGAPHFFAGMSGVVYALFGYIWMKGVYQPEQGMILHPNTITIMLLWLVLCMTGAMGPIANAAHFMGLVAGVAAGVSRF